ncbi:MAG: DUF1911 domain-containing protein [Azonexus sp.]|jgi:hypothetical protein|nr:DUF1911 domain-containing protein [Azonexus sp.]
MNDLPVDFTKKRRQLFLGEEYYEEYVKMRGEELTNILSEPFEDYLLSSGEAQRWGAYSRRYFERMVMGYTAGEPIEPMRPMLEQVIEALEKQATAERAYHKDEGYTPIGGGGESYLKPLQLIGLAYLLHRRDLLSRIAVLIDGLDGSRRGIDTTYERLLSFNDPSRKDPLTYINEDYMHLENALYEGNSREEALTDLNSYLKSWYKLHKGHLWHDSHLNPDNFFYFGYWSWEAAAVVYLLDLDDSSLRRYAYYPKDMIDWARACQDTKD